MNLSLSLILALLVQAPGWVEQGGSSPRYPPEVFLVGFAMDDSATAETRAKVLAATALAAQVRVRLKSLVLDRMHHINGEGSTSLLSLNQSLVDVRLSGLSYKVYRDGDRVYALAFVKRRAATRARQAEREQAMTLMRVCLTSAATQRNAGKVAAALSTFLRCRVPLNEAVEHEEVARALSLGESINAAAMTELAKARTSVDSAVRALLGQRVASLGDAAQMVAVQFARQGIGGRGGWTTAPLTYGESGFSSAFGRQLAKAVDARLVRQAPKNGRPEPVAIQGVYALRGELIHVVLTARSRSGKLVAAAEARLPQNAVPGELPLKPRNYQQALEDQRILGQGELVSGGLKVELWTNKGNRNLVYTAGEELRFYLRVNRPAWVRIVYLLQNGAKVPVEQAYFIDASKVNLAVEYPDAFEISAPFGVESMHATAFTNKPPRLHTSMKIFSGEEYEVLSQGMAGLVKHRGIKRKRKRDQVAEAAVTLTTLPR